MSSICAVDDGRAERSLGYDGATAYLNVNELAADRESRIAENCHAERLAKRLTFAKYLSHSASS